MPWDAKCFLIQFNAFIIAYTHILVLRTLLSGMLRVPKRQLQNITEKRVGILFNQVRGIYQVYTIRKTA